MFSTSVFLHFLLLMSQHALASSSPLPNQHVLDLTHSHKIPSEHDSTQQSKQVDTEPYTSPLKTGFVAFGDSYAAGIGTGSTDWNACRNGENSYPNLLVHTASQFVFYEMHQCTGARTDALLRPGGQIDSWFAQNLANFGTLSVGGDDLDFALVLDACVLRWQGPHSPDCDGLVAKARDVIRGDLGPRMLEIVKRVVAKAENDDFQLYWTGYPRFFNAETEWCSNVTFWFWQPGHHADAPRAGGEWAYLTKERRRMLNGIVDELDALIGQVVREAARYFQSDHKVIYFDTNRLFEGHRFCDREPDGSEVQEPDANRSDTWFFLSSWADNANRLPSPPDWGNATTTPHEQAQYMGIGDLLSMPAALRRDETCMMRYEEKRNTTEYVLCSIEMAAHNGFAYNDHAAEATMDWWSSQQPIVTRESSDGEIEQRGIDWYWPTEWIKTFHPRTTGYFAVRDEIVRYWKVRSEQE